MDDRRVAGIRQDNRLRREQTMRIASYVNGGEPALGLVTAERQVVPTQWRTFNDLFAEADPLAAVQALEVSAADAIAVERLLPPVVNRPQIIAVGGNYADHQHEARAAIKVGEAIFFPFLASAVIGPDDDIVIPNPETKTDYEVELTVVIGRTASRLTEDNAMDHVFGYTLVNDVSAREITERETFQIMLSKSTDTFVPVGPHLVTKDEIPDPYTLKISSFLNGQVRQDGTTGSMKARIPELLVALTRSVTLHAGDMITTGTPGGVGFFRDPPEFMSPGDEITISVW
jgi:2,4-didehydro-3-deoxy-L-rhamnonate hydrolase